uniref:Extended synaptotagmin-1-like n=1 Tax=Acanthochromis polyacanthus TaxID=80966 RepID=A0A3Q1GCX7_9TELE
MPSDKSEPTEPKAAECPSASSSEDKALSTVDAQSPKPKGISAVAVLWTFGKCLGALLPVYLAGYYRVSTSLLVCGMMVYTGWKHAREAKEAQVHTHFNPDTHLQTLSFTKVDMGDKAMKVVGIKAHTENDKGQVLLDLYISYVGNVEINVEVKRYFCKAGVKGIQLHGMMRVILEPLIGDVPIVGAVTMFFIRRPVSPSAITSVCPFQPPFLVMSDSMIMDAIASFLVLPNRLVVPLVPGLHVAQLRSPLPRGVVRIHLVEGQSLAAKDNYVKGVMAGLSDPYAILRVGPQTFTSQHIDNTDSPKWREMYEVIVHEVPGQELEVEVYDKDPDQDDFLGRTKLDLGIVKKSVVVDDWFTLKDTPSGRVHFRLEWLALLPSTDRLEQILKRNESVTCKTADPPSSAILVVYLDKAEALPMKKGNKEPNPMVQLSVQDITRESKTCYTTVNPEWEEAFTFFIQDPRKQDIDIQVKDADRVQTLGSLTIPLSRVLSNSNLSLDQWFQLDNSGSASRIYINTVLRVLWLDEDRISSEVSSTLEAGLTKHLPQQTSPHPSFATEGLLRIHLLAGQNLVPKDNLMGGMVKGKSDPYVKIDIGGETFTSHVVKNCAFINVMLPGQELHVEVLDKDMDMKDDFMGRLKISLKDIIDSQCTDQWYTLNDVKSGRIHLVLEWVPTASEPDRLDQVLQFYSRQSYQNKAVPSAGLLFVYIEQAHGLPVKKSGKDPKVGAEITLGEMSRKTTVCDRTTAPQWNEAFCFLVQDPREDILIIKLSHTWTLPIGSLVVPIRELLSEPELVLDQWFHLDGASPESQLLLRTELKMLIPSKCPGATEKAKVTSMSDPSPAQRKQEADKVSSSVDAPPVETIGSSVSINEDVKVKETAADVIEEKVEEPPTPVVTQPPHTSPDISFATEGLLRIILLEAQSLIAKDNMMGGMVKGKSDPYAKINVGDVMFKSNVVKENLNPVWNEMYEVVMKPQSGQEVMQLLSLQSYQNKAVPSAALLFVYVDRAHLLPFKKSGKEPKAGAELVFGDTTYKTKVCDRSRSPEWNEAFYFLVQDPTEEMLIIKLSSAWDQPMGSLVVPVRQLLSEPQLVLDKWMHLDGALPESKILLRAELKILNSRMTEVPVPSATGSKKEELIATERTSRAASEEGKSSELIHLLEAQNLVAKDNLMGGMVKGKSDPYVKINIGGVTFKSHVIKENLNPTWNEMYELVLSGHSVQDIKIEAFDKDLDSDDFLGRFNIRLNEVMRSQYTDQWYTLNDVKSGRLHLVLEWVPTVSDSVRLDQVLQLQSLQSYQNKAVPSAALLFVHLDRAHSLPLKKSGKEPKAGAELVLGETTHKTKLCDRSTSPQWNESFYFLVQDPKQQMLVMKLSSGWDQPMGSLVISVKELLAEPQLVLDQWFRLDGALLESQILLRAELKILDSKMVDLISTGSLPCAASDCGSGNGQVKLSLSYASQERKLIVVVHACRGLSSQGKDGIDSYVSLMLLPDKSKATKRKTAVKKRDLNPEYSERFEYDLPFEETRYRRLSVSVKNNSASFRSRDVVGQVQIELAQIDLKSGVTEW